MPDYFLGTFMYFNVFPKRENAGINHGLEYLIKKYKIE
jgi:hypothetical protein